LGLSLPSQFFALFAVVSRSMSTETTPSLDIASSPAVIVGRCQLAAAAVVGEYSPPPYLFPELHPFTSPPLHYGAVDAVDAARSAWLLTELTGPLPPAAVEVPSADSDRNALVQAALKGKLDFLQCVPAAEGGGGALLDEATLTDDEALKRSAIFASSRAILLALAAFGRELHADAETQKVLLSPQFLRVLGYQRLQQLRGHHQLLQLARCEDREPAVLKEEAEEPARKKGRTEGAGAAAAAGFVGSVDAWLESANAAQGLPPAVSHSAATIEERSAVFTALGDLIGGAWRSQGCMAVQTDIRPPGWPQVGWNAELSRPEASLDRGDAATVVEPVPSVAATPDGEQLRVAIGGASPAAAAAADADAAAPATASVVMAHDTITFGRGSASNPWFVDVPSVAAASGTIVRLQLSREHFSITKMKPAGTGNVRYVLANLSRNGVLVGHRWVLGDVVELKSGDIVRAAGVEFTVSFGGAAN
jgi:hypothetical protein